jgi:hypothetical protein
LIDRILDILEIVERLSGDVKWYFTVGKLQKRYPATQEHLQNQVTTSEESYLQQLKEERIQQMNEFFEGTLYNTLKINENFIKLEQFFQPHRAHSSLKMTLIKENPTTEEVNESMGAKIKSHPNGLANWLSTTMGENIQVEAVGPNFLLTNSKLNKSLLVKLHV